jgi:hypothetical protein
MISFLSKFTEKEKNLNKKFSLSHLTKNRIEKGNNHLIIRNKQFE